MAKSEGAGAAAPRLGKGGARRRRMFTPGELRAALLALLSRGPRHGYDLAAEIERLSGSAYSPSPGVLYPALQRLEREGLTFTLAQPDLRRRVYELTPPGRDWLDAHGRLVERAFAKLEAALTSPPRPGRELVDDAMRRLEAALSELGADLLDLWGARVAAKLDDLALMVRRDLQDHLKKRSDEH